VFHGRPLLAARRATGLEPVSRTIVECAGGVVRVA
jgi:hypothetical protein